MRLNNNITQQQFRAPFCFVSGVIKKILFELMVDCKTVVFFRWLYECARSLNKRSRVSLNIKSGTEDRRYGRVRLRARLSTLLAALCASEPARKNDCFAI